MNGFINQFVNSLTYISPGFGASATILYCVPSQHLALICYSNDFLVYFLFGFLFSFFIF